MYTQSEVVASVEWQASLRLERPSLKSQPSQSFGALSHDIADSSDYNNLPTN